MGLLWSIIRDSNIRPKKELHRKVWAIMTKDFLKACRRVSQRRWSSLNGCSYRLCVIVDARVDVVMHGGIVDAWMDVVVA